LEWSSLIFSLLTQGGISNETELVPPAHHKTHLPCYLLGKRTGVRGKTYGKEEQLNFIKMYFVLDIPVESLLDPGANV